MVNNLLHDNGSDEHLDWVDVKRKILFGGWWLQLFFLFSTYTWGNDPI